MFGLYGGFGVGATAFVPEGSRPAVHGDDEETRFCEGPYVVGKKLYIESSLHQSDKLLAAVTGHCVDKAGHLIDADDIARRYRTDRTLDVSALRGHFVVVIADNAKGELILARDRMAIAPLYVCRLSDGLLFSSEYKDFLPHLGDKFLDYPAIERFLTEGWMPAGRTFFRNIKPIAPGVLNVFGRQLDLRLVEGRTVLDGQPKVFFTADDVESALDTAVRRHIAPGPRRHGLMLSGGVDSALIAFLLKRALGGAPVHSHTVGYGKDDPEVVGARRTAAALGLDHTELFIDTDELTDLLPASIQATENIGGFDEYPCLYAMHKKAEERVDVMFSGNFSDALFGGMRMHREVWEASRGNGAALTPNRRAYSAASMLRSGPTETACDPLPARKPPQNLSDALTSFVLDRDERMSMQAMFAQWFGIQAQMPYTDFDVVSLGLRMPEEQKIDRTRNKLLLREFAARNLPPEIADRPKAIQQLKYDAKMQQWLLEQLSSFKNAGAFPFEQVLSEGYVDAVSNTLRHELRDDVVHAAWNVVAFAHWCESFV